MRTGLPPAPGLALGGLLGAVPPCCSTCPPPAALLEAAGARRHRPSPEETRPTRLTGPSRPGVIKIIYCLAPYSPALCAAEGGLPEARPAAVEQPRTRLAEKHDQPTEGHSTRQLAITADVRLVSGRCPPQARHFKKNPVRTPLWRTPLPMNCTDKLATCDPDLSAPV